MRTRSGKWPKPARPAAKTRGTSRRRWRASLFHFSTARNEPAAPSGVFKRGWRGGRGGGGGGGGGPAAALAGLLAKAMLVPSKSEARRMLRQGAVYVNGQRMDEKTAYLTKDGELFKVGKRRFVRLRVS